jgi:hypothetical protein
VIFRQGEIRDELASLASRAFTPSAVRNEPLMHDGANEHMRTLPNKVTNHDADKEAATGEDERGDFLIRGFWTAGTDCILDVRVTDRDAKSRSKRWSRRKKRRNTHFPQKPYRLSVVLPPTSSSLARVSNLARRLTMTMMMMMMIDCSFEIK